LESQKEKLQKSDTSDSGTSAEVPSTSDGEVPTSEVEVEPKEGTSGSTPQPEVAEVPTSEVTSEVTEVPTSGEVPEEVEAFVRYRYEEGLGHDDAARKAKLSGYKYEKYKNWIKEKGEAILKKKEKREEEIEKLRKRAEEADKRLKEAGITNEKPSEEKSKLIKEIERLEGEFTEVKRFAQRVLGWPTADTVKKEEKEKVEEEKKGEVPAEGVKEVRVVPWKLVEYPDGRKETQFVLAPEQYSAIKQTDMMTDTLMPDMMGELKGIRKDLSSIGTRIFTLLEGAILPRLRKGSYFPIPVTSRTREEREKELESYEKRIKISEEKEEKKEKK